MKPTMTGRTRQMKPPADGGCALCPRLCGAARERGERGYCGAGKQIRAALAELHKWEEPCIAGGRGAGAVFFSGCPLGCVYCQNEKISRGNSGLDITPERLAGIMLRLRDGGAACIDLVSPTPYVPGIIAALDLTGPLGIPVVYNTGGYERVETLRSLEGYADVYLPDLKYYDPALSERYSSAPDYFEVAGEAVKEMYRQTGDFIIGADGVMERGVLIRHLVLPGCRRDSARLMEWIAGTFPPGGVMVSLMRQYTPTPGIAFRELDRRVCSFEYDYVADAARSLGLRGYLQGKGSADAAFIPDFSGGGI